jgi:hypothetical protein
LDERVLTWEEIVRSVQREAELGDVVADLDNVRKPAEHRLRRMGRHRV